MYKTLEEKIKMIIEETAIVKINDTYSVCSDSLSNNIAGFLKNHEAKSDWVSVEDAMPENDGLYIVSHICEGKDKKFQSTEIGMWLSESNGFFATYYLKMITGDMIIELKDVTHWQPLPTPPKEV